MSNFRLVESFVKKLSNGSELSVCAFGFNSRNWWITFYLRERGEKSGRAGARNGREGTHIGNGYGKIKSKQLSDDDRWTAK